MKTRSMWVALALVMFSGPALAQGNPGTFPVAPAPRPSLPDGVTANWWNKVQQEIHDSEYFVTWQDQTVLSDLTSAWQAPNRAHNFRSYFTERGIRVVRRTETTPSWEWGLALLGVGRDDERSNAASARLATDQNRIDFDRARVKEWFVNSPDGIEHGFTIQDRPAAKDGIVAPGPLYVDLELTGGLLPVVAEDGQAITFFASSGGAILTYSQVIASDDRGRRLKAHLEALSEPGLRIIRIVVDDEDAEYPVAIDPIATSPFFSVEGDQDDSLFGGSVAAGGYITGSAYSNVLVAAPYYDNGQTGEGCVFVYSGSPSAPTLMMTLEADFAGGHFGASVAAAGDVNGDGYGDIIIGAPDISDGYTGGRVFVYHGSNAPPYLSRRWVHDGFAVGDQFGFSVSTAGDVNDDGFSDVVIGIPGYDRFNGSSYWYDAGQVIVYHGSADGLHTSGTGSVMGGAEGEQLGRAVSTAGDVNGDGFSDVIVGTRFYDNGTVTDVGRAQVFTGGPDGIGILPAAYWTCFGEAAASEFGYSVATAGDVNGDGYSDVIIGAKYFANGESGEGKVYVFHGPSLGTVPAWSVEGGKEAAFLGQSVATAGDVNGDGYADVIVGAYGYTNDLTKEGRAYVYAGSASGLGASPYWTGEGNNAYAEYGVSVSTAGDVNGDGYSDVIVGAWKWEDNNLQKGASYVYLGGPDGLASTSGWTPPSYGVRAITAGDVNADGYSDTLAFQDGSLRVYPGSSTGPGSTYYGPFVGDDSSFANSAASAGDVNGDGYDDIIVGEYMFDTGNVDAGKVFVFHGSATGVDTTADWTATGCCQYIWFGYSVASAGDRNGDGYCDVVIGAPRENTQTGAVYVANGSGTGLGGASWLASGKWPDDCFGYSVAGGGDIDGDGKSDIVIGAPEAGCNGTNPDYEGYFQVCYGGKSCDDGPTDCLMANATLGRSVAGAGDVNGDGYADVIVGAPGYDYGAGRACVYHGSSTGLPESAAQIVGKGLATGKSVAGAGDLNGDGFADVLIANNGHGYAYYGSAAGIASAESWSVTSAASHVSPAGDVNGDGFADAFVGKDLFYGGGGRGVSVRPRQLKTTATTSVIANLGMSDHPKNFKASLLGRTPFGRNDVRMYLYYRTLGNLFPGGGVASTWWADTFVGGVIMTVAANGYDQMALYHWRVRPEYKLTRAPYQKFGRYLTMPLKGWNETDLRTFVGDYDRDEHGTASDCDDTEDEFWSDPSEVRNLSWSSKTSLVWISPADRGCFEGLFYDTLRTTTPASFATATCIEAQDTDTQADDDETPGPGQVFFYLIRADNDCPGLGSLGAGSDGVPRVGPWC